MSVSLGPSAVPVVQGSGEHLQNGSLNGSLSQRRRGWAREGGASRQPRAGRARPGQAGREPLPLPLPAQAFIAQLYSFVKTGRIFQNIRHTLFKCKDRSIFQNQEELVGAALPPLVGLLGDASV